MREVGESAMTRRVMLGSAAAGAGLAAGAAAGHLVPSAQAQAAARTFVLVHGAWHGGWCWRRVSDLLEKKGHKVFAPTMTGLGERSHLLSKDINLDTHITDIVNVFKWEDLRNVCLVVHSYGGWPGSGAIEQAFDRISSIVWLDAFLPEDGQRGFDFANPQSRAGTLAAIEKGEAGRPAPKAEFFKVNEKDRAWVELEDHSAAGRRRDAADQAYRRAREGGQETLHSCAGISAGGVRRRLCQMQG